MGLSEGGDNTGPFPGARDGGFVEKCRELLRFQLQLQQPRLVLVLGIEVPSRVAAIAPALEPWASCHSLRHIDEGGLAIVEIRRGRWRGLAIHGLGSCPPSYGPSNVRVPKPRRPNGEELKGKEAEKELLRLAWDSAKRMPRRYGPRLTTAFNSNTGIGHAAMVAFLRLNGRRLAATADEAEHAILQVASGGIDRGGSAGVDPGPRGPRVVFHCALGVSLRPSKRVFSCRPVSGRVIVNRPGNLRKSLSGVPTPSTCHVGGRGFESRPPRHSSAS